MNSTGVKKSVETQGENKGVKCMYGHSGPPTSAMPTEVGGTEVCSTFDADDGVLVV